MIVNENVGEVLSTADNSDPVNVPPHVSPSVHAREHPYGFDAPYVNMSVESFVVPAPSNS